MIPFLDMKPAYAELKDELDAAYRRVMESGWYVLGREVEAFEAEYAAFCGTRHCVGVGNGLEALELALRAWDIGPGDEVIVPSNTYIATWLAVTAVGRDGGPGRADARRPQHRSRAHRRGHHPAHAGRSCRSTSTASRPTWMRSWTLARRHGLKVVEDVAQAQGARYRAGAPDRWAMPAPAASFRPRISAPWATAGRSPPTMPASPTACGRCATTAAGQVREPRARA